MASGKCPVRDEVVEISDDDDDVPLQTRSRHKKLARAPSYSAPINLDDFDADDSSATLSNRPSPLLTITTPHERAPEPAEFGLDDIAGEMLRDPEPFAGLPMPVHDQPWLDFNPPDIAPFGTGEGFRRRTNYADGSVTSGAPNNTNQSLSQDECLQQCLLVFPDISHTHVLDIYREYKDIAQVIEKVLDSGPYPKQRDQQAERRLSRRDSVSSADIKEYQKQDREEVGQKTRRAMLELLKAEFLGIPINFIETTQRVQRHVLPTYLALSEAEIQEPAPFRKGPGRVRSGDMVSFVRIRYGEEATSALEKEFLTARTECAKRRFDRDNLRRAKAAGNVAECSVCFDECPRNRMIYCGGESAHYTCYGCIITYIETEVGQLRCKIVCPAGDDNGDPCEKPFIQSQLELIRRENLLEKLAKLQQLQDVQEAGLGDLAECPFCDYKAIYPPIEDNFEFQCENEDCQILSCRRCNHTSHVPLSCQEFEIARSKDTALTQRHKVEEAMTAALVRTCNKCKKPFLKESGCNKMTCSCGNLQCYCCGKNVTNSYTHFHDAGACPLHDNLEERHRKDIKDAEAAARLEVQKENTNVSSEDLEIKVSDRIKQDEQARRQRNGDDFWENDDLLNRLHAERPHLPEPGAQVGMQPLIDLFEDDHLAPRLPRLPPMPPIPLPPAPDFAEHLRCLWNRRDRVDVDLQQRADALRVQHQAQMERDRDFFLRARLDLEANVMQRTINDIRLAANDANAMPHHRDVSRYDRVARIREQTARIRQMQARREADFRQLNAARVKLEDEQVNFDAAMARLDGGLERERRVGQVEGHRQLDHALARKRPGDELVHIHDEMANDLPRPRIEHRPLRNAGLIRPHHYARQPPGMQQRGYGLLARDYRTARDRAADEENLHQRPEQEVDAAMGAMPGIGPLAGLMEGPTLAPPPPGLHRVDRGLNLNRLGGTILDVGPPVEPIQRQGRDRLAMARYTARDLIDLNNHGQPQERIGGQLDDLGEPAGHETRRWSNAQLEDFRNREYW